MVPGLTDKLELKFNILQQIHYFSPVGRRVLSKKLHIGERIVRGETALLKEQGFIEINEEGMILTNEGKKILKEFKGIIYDINGINSMEASLKEILNIQRVKIIPGNIEEDSKVALELSEEAATYMNEILKDNDIIALTGGTTIKSVVDSIPLTDTHKNISVIPARGGMGRNIETQANILVASLANKLNGHYKMLHIPDNLSFDTMNSLLEDENIKDIFNMIQKANILLYSCGNADHIAKKRGLPKEMIHKLISLGAVGEAYGSYFNKDGEVVYHTPASGLDSNSFKNIDIHIAVAGGIKKAAAIFSSCQRDKKAILFTDEAAAKEIINLASNR